MNLIKGHRGTVFHAAKDNASGVGPKIEGFVVKDLRDLRIREKKYEK